MKSAIERQAENIAQQTGADPGEVEAALRQASSRGRRGQAPNVIEALYQRAIGQKYNRATRRVIDRRVRGDEQRKNRSTRRCSVCRQVTPQYQLIQPGAGRKPMCQPCRDAELRGEVV